MGKQTGVKNKKTEWVLFGLLIIAYIVVSFFHEPWFDEAQSWQIARCASFKDILFEIPHYEAHPPLWHLFLTIFAKTGVPYELGLSIASGIAVVASGWLILFKSPFPRLVRCLLPFHYFLFYQYGVVVRPYGFMGLGFLLLAMNFKKKNEKTWLFILLLALECLLSAYGIILAGGIAFAWFLEICQSKNWKLLKITFWKDIRVLLLGLLLILALFLVYDISPREDTVIGFAKIGQKILPCFLYTFLMTLPDCSILNIIKSEGILRYVEIGVADAILGCVIGILLLSAIVLFSSREKLKYFAFPYVFFACFSAYVYFATHHVGIALLFILFWLWINWEDENRGYLWNKFKTKIRISEADVKKIRLLGIGSGYLLVIVPVIWTLLSSVMDIQKPYFYSRDTAEFLLENHLEELNILCEWSGSALSGDDENVFYDMNTNVMKTAVTLAPYFEGNPFYNFNMGAENAAYVKFSIPTTEENREVVGTWAAKGKPDVIVGMVNPELLFGEEMTKADYAVVYKMRPVQFAIWKGQQASNVFAVNYVYMRKDLVEQYGLATLGESPID